MPLARRRDAGLSREIRRGAATAEEQDRLEDEEFGPDFRGDELPAELSRRKSRLDKIRAANKRLEERKAQEAREKDERKAAQAAREGRDPPRERPELRKHPKGKPRPKDQENFTDPDSRVMDAGGGNFQQSYNAQIAVDAQEQIVVAAWVGQCAVDSHHLIPVLEEVHKNTNRRPDRVLADTGYRSEDNLRHLKEQGIHGYVAVGREGMAEVKLLVGPIGPATR